MRALALPAMVALAGCAGVLPFGDGPAPPAAATSAATGNPPLTIVLAAAVPRAADARSAISRALGKSFELGFAETPNIPLEAADHRGVEDQLAMARKAYTAAEFAPCLARLGEAERVAELLGQDERLLAGRLLFWRVACRVGAGHADDARRDAALFATFDLPLPPEVYVAAPDVEALLADAARSVAAEPRLPLRVAATATGGATPHARVSVDGRADVCVAPCTVDVHAGDHAVRVDADGFAPERRVVRVAAGGAATTVELSRADPPLAARQWSARHAGRAAIDDSASVALLATALRARSLAVVTIESAPRGRRLVGVLALDGAVAARSERLAGDDAAVPDAAPALVRDLLLRGRLLEPAPPLHRRPLFWVGVGLAAVAAAAVTAVLLYDPPRRVQVTF